MEQGELSIEDDAEFTECLYIFIEKKIHIQGKEGVLIVCMKLTYTL